MIVRVVSAENPAASWLLRILRDEGTGVREFREAMRRAGLLLGFEVAKFLEWRRVKVRTPLGEDTYEVEPAENPLVVAILGASLPLAEGILEVYPGAPLGLVSARRIEEGEELRVEVNYVRLPREWEGPVVVADPMLATGMTIERVIDEVKARGASRVLVATVIAAVDGIRRVASKHDDVIVVALAVDPRLDDRYFIRPGLGDAGDRGLGVVP